MCDESFDDIDQVVDAQVPIRRIGGTAAYTTGLR
jgi:hypothetical protein